jgi:hypothetical protein
MINLPPPSTPPVDAITTCTKKKPKAKPDTEEEDPPKEEVEKLCRGRCAGTAPAKPHLEAVLKSRRGNSLEYYGFTVYRSELLRENRFLHFPAGGNAHQENHFLQRYLYSG